MWLRSGGEHFQRKELANRFWAKSRKRRTVIVTKCAYYKPTTDMFNSNVQPNRAGAAESVVT